MFILSFLKGVVSSFFKKDIKQKIDQIQQKLSVIIVPTTVLYAQSTADGTIKERTPKSNFVKKFFVNLLGYIPQQVKNDQTPYARTLNVASNNAITLLDLLTKYVQTRFSDTVEIEGLTYQRATVLRIIELLDFYVDYTIRNISAIVAAESNITAFDGVDDNFTTKRELQYLLAHQTAYVKVLGLLLNDPKLIVGKLEEVPEVFVDADVAATPSIDSASADPLHLGSIAALSFIFHWVGIRMADWDAARWERAQKEKLTLTLRLEAIKAKQRGTPDARSESLIEGYERELILIRDRIDRIEAKARTA